MSYKTKWRLNVDWWSVRLDAVSVCIIALAIIFPGFLLLQKLTRQLNGITFLDVLLFFFQYQFLTWTCQGCLQRKLAVFQHGWAFFDRLSSFPRICGVWALEYERIKIFLHWTLISCHVSKASSFLLYHPRRSNTPVLSCPGVQLAVQFDEWQIL